ncbi:hypothetical protein HYW54_01970 [Candidatus Gottesmanbacteria bacterium]|nr:hypothetical protein [Candidatus Gottesmanbacteria bacterium]
MNSERGLPSGQDSRTENRINADLKIIIADIAPEKLPTERVIFDGSSPATS